MEVLRFKRGDTFFLTCTVDQDITGWTVQSQIRQNSGTLIDTLTPNITSSSPTQNRLAWVEHTNNTF